MSNQRSLTRLGCGILSRSKSRMNANFWISPGQSSTIASVVVLDIMAHYGMLTNIVVVVFIEHRPLTSHSYPHPFLAPHSLPHPLSLIPYPSPTLSLLPLLPLSPTLSPSHPLPHPPLTSFWDVSAVLGQQRLDPLAVIASVEAAEGG